MIADYTVTGADLPIGLDYDPRLFDPSPEPPAMEEQEEIE